jgi:hypothetical protein
LARNSETPRNVGASNGVYPQNPNASSSGIGNGKIGRQAAYLPDRCLRDGVGGRNGNSRLLAAQFSAPKLIFDPDNLVRELLLSMNQAHKLGRRSAAKLLTKHEARWIAANNCQVAGVAASKVITGPVSMSAFGGKADMTRTCRNVR